MHTSIHSEFTGVARHSLTQWFSHLFRALPGDRIVDNVTGEVTSASLTPAPRRQDHTTSPSAPVATKADRRSWYQSRRSFGEGGSAPLVLRRCRVHRIPCPTSVTIAIRPSGGPERRQNSRRPRADESQIFLR